MSNKSINLYLSEDILCVICEYFDPCDLLAAEEVCSFWLTCVRRDQQFWERHCINIWHDEELTMNVPDLEDISIMSRIKQIPLLQLKRALIRVDLTRCVEKIDFQRTFLAKLLFGQRSAENSTALRAYYPEWAFKMGIYKATYFYGCKERQRNNAILVSELCGIDWEFKFKYHDEPEIEANRMRSEFKPDFTLVSGLNGAIYNWQFVTHIEHGEEITKIQVEHYPPLTISRLNSGAWMLENQHVIFHQRKSLDKHNLPLL